MGVSKNTVLIGAGIMVLAIIGAGVWYKMREKDNKDDDSSSDSSNDDRKKRKPKDGKKRKGGKSRNDKIHRVRYRDDDEDSREREEVRERKRNKKKKESRKRYSSSEASSSEESEEKKDLVSSGLKPSRQSDNLERERSYGRERQPVPQKNLKFKLNLETITKQQEVPVQENPYRQPLQGQKKKPLSDADG